MRNEKRFAKSGLRALLPVLTVTGLLLMLCVCAFGQEKERVTIKAGEIMKRMIGGPTSKQVESAESGEPTDTTESADSTESDDTTDTSESADTTESAETTESTESGESTEPARAIKPTKSKKPPRPAGQSRPIPPTPKSDRIKINFQDADLLDVIRFFGKLTDKNFLIDKRVEGNVTIVFNKEISINDAYRVFLATLEMNGFAVVEEGTFSRIVPTNELKDEPQEVTVVPLRYASAGDLAGKLSLFISSRSTTRRVRSVKKVEAEPLKSISLSNPRIVADERTNSLVINTTKDELKSIKELIQQLDQPLPLARNRIHVYYLQNARAEELVEVLTKLPTDKQPQQSAEKGQPAKQTFSEDIQFFADQATNSLIIFASPQDYSTMRHIIEKLDIPRSQVLVEGLIAEVSMDKAKEVGVEWQYLSHDQGGDSRSFASFNAPKATDVPLSDAKAGLPADLGTTLSLGGMVMGVFKGPISIAGQEFLNLNVLLRALQDQSNVNVLSTPHVLTMDNQEAEIIIAENRPFLRSQTGTAESTSTNITGTTSTAVLQTFEFKDVGITLRITPQINRGRMVRLNIFQEVSDVLGQIEASGAFITSKRQAKTTVVVKDGQTVVIGGLIQDRTSRGGTSVPCLGNMPYLGALFRSRDAEDRKRNLLIFITPHIVTTPEELAEISEKKKQESEEQELLNQKWKEQDLKETIDMILK